MWPERLGFRLRPTRVPLVALGTNPTLSATLAGAKVTRFLTERLLFASDTPSAQLHTNPPGLNGRLEMDNWIAAGVKPTATAR